eukprot:4424717-Pleurochrysis_carterae.AAC.1
MAVNCDVSPDCAARSCVAPDSSSSVSYKPHSLSPRARSMTTVMSNAKAPTIADRTPRGSAGRPRAISESPPSVTPRRPTVTPRVLSPRITSPLAASPLLASADTRPRARYDASRVAKRDDG